VVDDHLTNLQLPVQAQAQAVVNGQHGPDLNVQQAQLVHRPSEQETQRGR
jgi:hypothetical protein